MQPERHFCEIFRAFSQRGARVESFILFFIQRSQTKKKMEKKTQQKNMLNPIKTNEISPWSPHTSCSRSLTCVDLKPDLVKVLQSLLKLNKYKSNTNIHVKFNTNFISHSPSPPFFFLNKSETGTPRHMRNIC